LKVLLKSFNLSDDAISIYLEGLGKFPSTFSEIQKIVPKVSEREVKLIVDELVQKKLFLLVNSRYSESLPHYIAIPPFAAMLNSLSALSEVPDNTIVENSKNNPSLERFQDILYQDLENISGDLIEVLSDQEKSSQTMEILSEVEENVKKFARMILNDVIEMISPLRMQSAVDARDFSKLINSVKKKISESEEITQNMFSQFKEIVNEMGSPAKLKQVEAFKTFIRRLGETIEKRVQEISPGVGNISSEKIKLIENSLYDVLTNYINIYQVSFEKFWFITSYEKFNEIVSILLDKCTNFLTIIVPHIENFIPLGKFSLDYSEEAKKDIVTQKTTHKKPVHTRHSITKKQKKEIEEKFDLTSKKVAELKGFELSHDVAEILALISNINPESNALESIQNWLNRLLIIRKYLDSNTQYLILEDIEKWKIDYLKVKKKEEPEEVLEELKAKMFTGKSKEKTNFNGLKIKIVSSDPHENKHALAFAKKANIEYLQFERNNVFTVNGDNSYLAFGVYHKPINKPTFDINGFFTTYKPLIEIISPLIAEISKKAKYPKEIEINRGFNEVIENINDYSGKRIGKKLETLLDVVFEKDGISLDILELKLLIGKLKKIYHPLDDEMKEYVIKELNNLNKKFSSLELINPPEFKVPIIEGEIKGELKKDIKLPVIEAIDPEKIDNLFELLLEKVDDLKGVEISEQIDKLIEIVLKLQGYSYIIEWKNNLSTIDKTLEESFREKIKEDLLTWRLGILKKKSSFDLRESTEFHGDSKQANISTFFEENCVSPGSSQSQFRIEEASLSTEEENKSNPKIEIKELFNRIHTKLGELSGMEISKILQNIVNVILETEGYSMVLKGVKDWINKLRKIKEPLESELKDDFQLEYLNWKEKYCSEDNHNTLDFKPSFKIAEETRGINGNENSENLRDKFNTLMQNAQNFKGDKLSNELQNIADIVLQSHGAVAVNVIRQWISKLRSLKEILDDDLKEEFLSELKNWKEKFV